MRTVPEEALDHDRVQQQEQSIEQPDNANQPTETQTEQPIWAVPRAGPSNRGCSGYVFLLIVCVFLYMMLCGNNYTLSLTRYH